MDGITRRDFCRILGLGAAVAPFASLGRVMAQAGGGKQPNILWLVSEDNSPSLGCYGDAVARTPQLDQLASQGYVYDNAFANVGVCAPSRFSIITGRLPSSHYGSQGMRGGSPLPPHIHFFPKYLRDAGYWTSNGGKTDYNTSRDGAMEEAWDSKNDHWRQRPDKNQPFFKIFNTMHTHESRVFPPRNGSPRSQPKTDPSAVTVPPYKPDTPLAREDIATYYDKIASMDAWVGTILKELEEDGLADDTIVFYYSDHGGVLGRSKRFIYDSGTRVALIVRFGKNFQHLAPDQSEDGHVNRLVSLMDLGPTVLSLVGLEAPEHMHGRAFLGKHQAEPKDYVFFPRQRMDERIDLSRGLRDKRFLYIRNYLPHWPWGRHVSYMFRIPSTQEWYDLWKQGDLPPEQARFFEPKGYEEFFDTQADPGQIRNLISEPEFAGEIERFRKALDSKMLETEDTGLYWGFAHEDITLQEAMQQAATAARGRVDDLPEIIAWLGAESPVTRFWAAMGCAVRGEAAASAKDALAKALQDPEMAVRVIAAGALSRMGEDEKAIPIFREALEKRNEDLWALNIMQLIGPKRFRVLKPEIESVAQDERGYGQRAAPWLLETLEQ